LAEEVFSGESLTNHPVLFSSAKLVLCTLTKDKEVNSRMSTTILTGLK
jgi:hypothetical protein